MATFHDSTTLPKTRTALEALIEAAIARLDELDGDPDLEPTMGAPSPQGTPCIEVGRWMADQLDRIADGQSGSRELFRVPQLSQARWADGNALDECEEVSEDEGADNEFEPSLGALEHVNQLTWAHTGTGDDREYTGAEDDYDYKRTSFDYAAYQVARQRVVEAAQAAVEGLRAVQRRAGRKPAQPLRTICGAIMR